MVKPQKLSESVMASTRQTPVYFDTKPAAGQFSAVESARYTADLLDNLQKLALLQGQSILAHLLELARTEARMVVRDTNPEVRP